MDAASALANRRRILLVDDVELNRVLTEAVLRSATYDVDSVSDGASAIAALEAGSYDLVLMDLEMPDLDGHAAAAEIRRRELKRTGRGVKLAAISAQNGDVVRLRSAEVGMTAHIARQIAPHELLRRIEQVFCQPEPDPVPDPWHQESYDEWVARLGPSRMNGFLVSLLDQFRNLLMLLTANADAKDLHHRAHDVASTGGTLGFLDVTRCCRAVLEAPDAEKDDAVRGELSKSLVRAIARLDRHILSTDRGAEAA